MLRTGVSIIAVAVLSTALAVPQQVPPNHPPVGGAPPPAAPDGSLPPQADPADVASIDAAINAYYDVISGPKGEERNWDRFRSLFIADARLITSKSMSGRTAALRLTPEQFITANRRYFEKGGYFEREVFRKVDRFGNMAHAFSTYEARQREDQADPYSRGINSIQLLSDGTNWWIVTIMWDHERPHENPVPAEYLP